ncbi:tyrosine--tRNA ligase [Polymorphobacter sp. PAMC 29334]|uniref:tyrosine--tRNA ligase n=1 Tax=Polymorphobacter sp. PAMC 29334 TaxID=2862331 RepID=UPI001C7900E5|nr:tyrosine--tRNA ligase [Polymorphobacter sp. PAMC 29334]QYE36521.1 tyrosine--tRNA ligase [Polymorphobacter sp. PAMC 29334]
MTHASTFLRTLDERGFVHQITDAAALDAAALAGPVTAYVGYDCTAPSLHVGNLVSIMMLRHLQQSGHKPVVLMGGGTTKVGDPSGKDEGRQLLDDARIAANMASIRRIFERFLDFEGPNAAVMLNNADWLDGLAYIPFLRDIGRHFSVNRMLTFDSVKLRLDREQPLSFLEFNYMILQAYDFLELSRRTGCSLQMGGSDQWGNIVNGTDLIRRVDAKPAFGLTTPLITTADGAKMGKTAAGAVWLHEDSLPAYDYWQFWRNTHDADVGRFLRLFTDLPLDEIEAFEALPGAEINAAKIALANAATALCRGEAAAVAAAETARATFAGDAGNDLPSFAIAGEVSLLDALIGLGFAASKGDARRLVRGGGARVDGVAVTDEAMLVSAPAKVSAGKKRHGVLVEG